MPLVGDGTQPVGIGQRMGGAQGLPDVRRSRYGHGTGDGFVQVGHDDGKKDRAVRLTVGNTDLDLIMLTPSGGKVVLVIGSRFEAENSGRGIHLELRLIGTACDGVSQRITFQIGGIQVDDEGLVFGNAYSRKRAFVGSGKFKQTSPFNPEGKNR